MVINHLRPSWDDPPSGGVAPKLGLVIAGSIHWPPQKIWCFGLGWCHISMIPVHLSNEKQLVWLFVWLFVCLFVCLFDIGDYTTQLYGHYNQYAHYKDPSQPTSIMECQ